MIAEVVKPEDADAVAAARRPVLVVLNKADLGGGLADGGPLAAARARCPQFAELLRVPVEPMSGLLAVAALDDLDEDLWAALRVLADHPGGLAALDGSFDGFLAAWVPVPTEARRRLLEALDLFGTALGVAALRHRTAAQALALWRRISRVDAVVDGLVAVGAGVRYQRLLDAVAELEALAVSQAVSRDGISEFLTSDDTVIARMAAALEVVEASELQAGPAAHLQRAVHWQRYGSGPVGDLCRACAADITRGSLRLWSRAGGEPT